LITGNRNKRAKKIARIAFVGKYLKLYENNMQWLLQNEYFTGNGLCNPEFL
jgi:hypothetical protein